MGMKKSILLILVDINHLDKKYSVNQRQYINNANKSVLSDFIFYIEGDYSQGVDFNCEIFAFTLIYLKIFSS